MLNGSLKVAELLSKREAAELLGVSPRTLDLWLRQRRLPYVKLGPTKKSLVRFKRTDLDTMIDHLTVKASYRG